MNKALVETLVILTIIVMLALVGTGFRGLFGDCAINSAQREFSEDVQEAREAGVTRNFILREVGCAVESAYGDDYEGPRDD